MIFNNTHCRKYYSTFYLEDWARSFVIAPCRFSFGNCFIATTTSSIFTDSCCIFPDAFCKGIAPQAGRNSRLISCPDSSKKGI
ncbi:MAG: hypothetical protein AAB795_02405 [Patescibacteria group bacterium]